MKKEKPRLQVKVVIYEDLDIETDIDSLIDTLTDFKNNNLNYDSITLEIDSYCDYYDEVINKYNIVGYRPENDEELNKRLQIIERSKNLRLQKKALEKEQNRKLYEKLKFEFEKNG